MVTARHRVKMTWEDGGRDQPQAKESQEPPEAEVLRSKEDSTSPWTFGVKMLTPSFQTSGLQHCEKEISITTTFVVICYGIPGN